MSGTAPLKRDLQLVAVPYFVVRQLYYSSLRRAVQEPDLGISKFGIHDTPCVRSPRPFLGTLGSMMRLQNGGWPRGCHLVAAEWACRRGGVLRILIAQYTSLS